MQGNLSPHREQPVAAQTTDSHDIFEAVVCSLSLPYQMWSCGGVGGFSLIGAQDELLLRSCFVEVVVEHEGLYLYIPCGYFYIPLRCIYRAVTKNRYYTWSGFLQNGYTKTKHKTHPRAITLLIGRTHTEPVYQPFSEGQLTHRYTCRRLMIYFDVSRFGLDGSRPAGTRPARIRVPKPRKSSVVASFCSSRGLGVFLFYALYYQQGAGTAVMIRAWFVRMNMWTYLARCA